MNEIEKLIKKLCPDGVPVKQLGEIMTRAHERRKADMSITQVYVVSNTQGMVRAEEYRDNLIHSEDTSNYTIVRQGMFAYNPSRLNVGSIAMLKDETPGLVSPMYIVFSVDESIVEKNFFEYYLRTDFVREKINSLKEEGARFRFDFSRWNRIPIPIPPIEIQNKIVEILDKFKNFNASLEAELEARKKQYAFYREQLLSFKREEKRREENAVRFLTLGDICNFQYGYTAKARSEGEACFIRITDISDGGLLNNFERKFVNLEKKALPYLISHGDILVARTGATYGKTLFYDSSLPAVFASFLIRLDLDKSIISNRYYWHFSKSNSYWEQAKKMVSSGGQPQFNANVLAKIKIPVPALEEQERIVGILDKFDRLVNDLSEGLPAEIEARRAQYAHYREKLLSF